MSSAEPFDGWDWLALALGVAICLAAIGCGDAEPPVSEEPAQPDPRGFLLECDQEARGVTAEGEEIVVSVYGTIQAPAGSKVTITRCRFEPEECLTWRPPADGHEIQIPCEEFDPGIVDYSFDHVYALIEEGDAS